MSAVDQDPALQIAALEAAGVERLYTDHLPGNAAERPGLERALDALHPGDTLVCWRLDPLGARSSSCCSSPPTCANATWNCAR